MKECLRIFRIPLLCLFLAFLQLGSGAKIIMTSAQFSSHNLQQVEVGSELVRRGHQVYLGVGSRYPKKDIVKKKGIKLLFYHIPDHIMYGFSDEYDLFIADKTFTKTLDMPETSAMTYRDCELMMNDQTFLDQVRKLKFDLAIVEPFTLSPCTLLLPRYLSIPFVSLTIYVAPWSARLPALPSFFPMFNPFKKYDETTLIGRIENLLTYIVIGQGIMFPGVRNTTLLKRYAPELESWNALEREAELYLVASDHHMKNPLPIFPNIITIAGLTCAPAKKLEPNLEKFMSDNKDGVILMSFGSMAYRMPKDVIVKFLEAFGKLKQTVLARLQPIEGVKVPKNVKLFSWLPQNDMLGHINTKLFINHCGLNGQYEALYHGVPMLGFPLFAEQSMNCRQSYDKGFGLTMNIHEFTSFELYENIMKILSDPTFTSNIKRASEIFRDEPIASRDKASFWIEHVIKYGGRHLRSPANDQPLYQFLMLDIIAFIFGVLLILLMLLKSVSFLVFNKLFFSRNSKMVDTKLKAQ